MSIKVITSLREIVLEIDINMSRRGGKGTSVLSQIKNKLNNSEKILRLEGI